MLDALQRAGSGAVARRGQGADRRRPRLHHRGDDPLQAARQGRARPVQGRAVPTGTPRSPTRPGSPPGGWPASSTRRPTARRCSRGSSPRCPTATRNCCAGCSPARTWTALTGGGACTSPSTSRWSSRCSRPWPPGRSADRLPPAAATWLLAVSALVLALASSAVLGMLALSALVRIPFVDAVGHLSAAVIRSGDAVSLPVALVAGGLLALAAVAAGRAVCGGPPRSPRRTGTRAACPGASQVVVTEDAAADAYTMPGWPCRIVITQGMLGALSAARARCPARPRARARQELALPVHVGRPAGRRRQPAAPPGRRRGRLRDRALGRRAGRGGHRRPGAHRPRRRPRRAGDLRLPAGP